MWRKLPGTRGCAQEPVSEEGRRLALLAALLLPLRAAEVEGGKLSLPAHIILNAIKWKRKDAEAVATLHAAAPELLLISATLQARLRRPSLHTAICSMATSISSSNRFPRAMALAHLAMTCNSYHEGYSLHIHSHFTLDYDALISALFRRQDLCRALSGAWPPADLATHHQSCRFYRDRCACPGFGRRSDMCRRGCSRCAGPRAAPTGQARPRPAWYAATVNFWRWRLCCQLFLAPQSLSSLKYCTALGQARVAASDIAKTMEINACRAGLS